jgi:hypothetical protein
MTALYNIGDFVEFVERPALVKPLPKVWYLLRLHPNYDRKAERQLRRRGVSVYVPKEKRTVKGVWNRRMLREVPIFSGGMFIPDFEADLPRLKSIADGIGGFVRFGAEPLCVSLAWMDRIRKFEETMNLNPGQRKFNAGQHVRIVGGMWDMWEGKIARLDSHYRLSVLIDILGREVPIQFDEDQVEAVERPKVAKTPKRAKDHSSARGPRLKRGLAR